MYACIDLGVERWVIISMEVLCDDIIIAEHDGRRPELPSAPLDMEYDNGSIE